MCAHLLDGDACRQQLVETVAVPIQFFLPGNRLLPHLCGLRARASRLARVGAGVELASKAGADGVLSCWTSVSMRQALSNGRLLLNGNSATLVALKAKRSSHIWPWPSLGKQTCFSQKHATDEFSSPSSPRCSSSLAPAGSLMTGAVCLKILPPRSRTKWLWVAIVGEGDRQVAF
ncbi:MAG: hypothetical protein IPP44_03980 [Ideonella sp.]|nr:hypothetical protein [Ideonella sp.]